MKPTNSFSIFLTGITALLISGCGNDNQITQAPGPENGIIAGAQLVPVTSGDELEDYLKQGLANTNMGIPDYPVNDSIPETATDESLAADTDGASTSSRTSGTNLQVSGADEADRIKTDGNYLYSIKQQNFYYPADNIAVTEPALVNPDYTPIPASINVHRIQADPAGSELVTEIKIDEDGASINGIYLTTDESGQGEQLIATGSGHSRSGVPAWDNPWAWQSGQTKVWFFDVNTPETPQQIHSLTLEGYLLSSRRIKDKLYLVTRFTPYIVGFANYPTGAVETDSNQSLLDETPLDELLPRASLDNADPEPLMPSHNCFLPDTIDASYTYPTLTTITAIDLNSPKESVSVCYGGYAYGMYASTKSIYLTASRYRPQNSDDGSDNRPSFSTAIHKFAMTEKGPQYQGSGLVPGSLTINGNSPSFLMGERDDVLHVITSWRGENRWQHRLTNLRSNEDNTALNVIAQLPNAKHPEPIGKPNEQIYASRYIGDRAYVVTFETIDPLYVIDLSDDSNPVIAGELEIPGYSSYLHAINKDLLLGIGRDAVADESGNFSWFQSLKLSIFDVSDISTPKEISTLAIGDRGTDSPILSDHHALAYLPGKEDNADRFTLPIRLHEGGTRTRPWQWADWKHSGLYLFEIDKSDTSVKAKLNHHGTIIAEKATDKEVWNWRGVWNDRAVIHGSAVHYLHDNTLISADWDAVIP